MSIKQLFIIALLSVGYLINLSGCNTPSYVNEEELYQYVFDTDHGLVQEKHIKDLKVQVLYKPTDLLVAQELGEHKDIKQVEELRNKYGQYKYFILGLSSQNQDVLYRADSYGDFSQNLQSLAFRMDQFVNLTTSGRDTIPVSDFVFPRLYGHGKSTQLLFAFNKEELQNIEWVQFNLKEFGMGTGQQSFRFQMRDLARTPNINFNQPDS